MEFEFESQLSEFGAGAKLFGHKLRAPTNTRLLLLLAPKLEETDDNFAASRNLKESVHQEESRFGSLLPASFSLASASLTSFLNRDIMKKKNNNKQLEDWRKCRKLMSWRRLPFLLLLVSLSLSPSPSLWETAPL